MVDSRSLRRLPLLLIGPAALFLHFFPLVFFPDPAFAAANPDTLKIGVLAPLSGPYASGGASFVQAATLAVEQANAEGGVFGQRVTIVVGDTQGRVDVAKSEALRLVSREKVSALVGAYLSEETVGVMEVAAAQRTVLLVPVAATAEITDMVRREYARYRYEHRYGAPPVGYRATLPSDALTVLVAAWRKAGTAAADAVVPVLERGTFAGVAGVYRFDAAHQAQWGTGPGALHGTFVRWEHGG